MRKLQTNRASTTDMSGATVNVGDYINIVDTAALKAGPAGAKKERGGKQGSTAAPFQTGCAHSGCTSCMFSWCPVPPQQPIVTAKHRSSNEQGRLSLHVNFRWPQASPAFLKCIHLT